MIRLMEESDLQEVLEIYNDIILTSTAVYIYEEQTLEDRKIWYNSKRLSGYPLLVFEEGGKIAGFATYGQFRPYPAYKYTVEHSVYVHKAHYHKGIATKLMNALIEIAKAQGIMTMIAGIDGENVGSVRTHEKLGFEYAGTLTKAGYKFGRWLDLVFYQLHLAGPSEPIEI